MEYKSRESKNYISTINLSDAEDLEYLAEVRSATAKCKSNLRVVLRGRKAIKKMKVVHPYYSFANSKGEVQYDYFGNIVGGIKNAQYADIYIYKKY